MTNDTTTTVDREDLSDLADQISRGLVDLLGLLNDREAPAVALTSATSIAGGVDVLRAMAADRTAEREVTA